MNLEPDDERRAEQFSCGMYLVVLESIRESHMAGLSFKTAWIRAEAAVIAWALTADPEGNAANAWDDYREEGFQRWRSVYTASNYDWLAAMVAVA